MTPAAAMGMLDRALGRDGTLVTINQAASNGGPATQTIRAFVRGYQPQELTGDINQDDRKAILSPTGLTFTPGKLDEVVIQGVTCNIEAVDLVTVAGAVVRIEMQVRG